MLALQGVGLTTYPKSDEKTPELDRLEQVLSKFSSPPRVPKAIGNLLCVRDGCLRVCAIQQTRQRSPADRTAGAGWGSGTLGRPCNGSLRDSKQPDLLSAAGCAGIDPAVPLAPQKTLRVRHCSTFAVGSWSDPGPTDYPASYLFLTPSPSFASLTRSLLPEQRTT